MKQTILLQEIIDDLINIDKSLSSPLIKLNYFAKLIKNKDLIDYTQNELNGYNNNTELLPNYRKAKGTLLIDIKAHIYLHKGKQLPISMFDEKYRDALENVYIRDGIAVIERLANEAKEKSSTKELVIQLPIEMLSVIENVARKIYDFGVQFNVTAARITWNSAIVIEIPNAIRTKLLDFVMSIADNFGYDIEIETFNKKADINNQTIINQMNTTINNSGDGNLINTGNENQIENKVSIYKGDLDRLNRELTKQGIAEEDLRELDEIVRTETPNHENNRLGEKANGWVSNIINKSLNGIGKIATGISSNLLATIIKQYYGMP
jgi:hypothetical protein